MAMAMAGLNFIRDASAYKAKLFPSDGVVLVVGLANIWHRIADLIREAAAL